MSLKTLVLASKNQGKIREVREFFRSLNIKIISLRDLPDPPTIEEAGSSFEDIALTKARIMAKYSGKITLADDSGLSVDSLKGTPGIRSARYAGVGASDEDNNIKLLGELKKMELPLRDRGASFICAMALVTPDGREEVAVGECRGLIIDEPRGHNGFGYDPIFFAPEYNATFAEMGPDLKGRISHRAMALEKIKKTVIKFMGLE